MRHLSVAWSDLEFGLYLAKMYHVVKARFLAKNPTGERSLLENFTVLLDIANTDNSEYVWKVVNECDLDFNMAAERLLLRPPPPFTSSPSALLGQRFTPPHSSPPSKTHILGPELSSTAVSDFSSSDLPSSPKRLKVSEIQMPSPATAPKVAPSVTSVVGNQLPDFFERSSFSSIKQSHFAIPSDVIRQVERLHKKMSDQIQAEGITCLRELACLEFNLLCDAVSGITSDSGVVSELNKRGAFANAQQLAMSGELWSFVPISNFELSGAEVHVRHKFSKLANDQSISVHRREAVLHYVKLNSHGLFLKLEYKPVASGQAPSITEIFVPFSSFAEAPEDKIISVAQLSFRIKVPSDIVVDSAFSSIYSCMGSTPSASLLVLSFFDISEAQTLYNDIVSLRKCHSPHALDISKLAQPVPAWSSGFPAKKLNLNIFSDAWRLARVLFDEKLLAETRANENWMPHVPMPLSCDIKFVMRFKYPSFLMPVMMRAKARMRSSSWSRDCQAIGKLFDRLIRRESVARAFPFLNAGVDSDKQSTHGFFEIPSLFISSIAEDEITAIFYHNSTSSGIPHAMSNYLNFNLKERASGKIISTFNDYLACQGALIMSRQPLPPPNLVGAVVANSASTANSTSEWMKYLALNDADTVSESELPSFFHQSLLPSQRQSLNFMIEMEKRPCSDHLFKEFEVDESLAASEITHTNFRTPVQHSRFFSLCTINSSKFVSSPPQIKGGLLCDPMGSGKTRTCIAMIAATLAVSRGFMSASSKQACNLILVPPNVLGHWIRELESCFGIQHLEKRGSYIGPDVSIALLHGNLRPDLRSNSYDIVLSTYNTFNSRKGHPGFPLKYFRVFCDEAHAFRNGTRGQHGINDIEYDSIWLVTGTPIVLLAEDLNPLLECFKLRMPKETFRSLLSTNLNVFGPERQKALAILKPIIVYHSPNSIIGGVPVTCSVGSEIVTVRIIAGPREVQVYESFRGILQRSQGIHAVLSKIIEGLRRACSPRSFDPAAYLQLVTNSLNQVEIRLREEPEYVPRMVEAKFVEKTIVQALEYVSTPYAKARIRELWEYLSNSEEKDPHECTVCMEVMKDPLITSCGHWFCSECVTGVLDSQLHMCPICRTRTTNKNLIKLIGWQARVPSSIKPETAVVVASQPAEEASKVNSSAGAVAVDADTPSKLIYLRRKLISWADTDDKIVIFSEFQGCLNSVVELANSMGINAAVLNHSLSLKKRSQRIAEFQDHSSSLRLLAVSVATCGVGISLSAATQVLFTEPLISEALEKQCIARVCRWGQSRFCHMERLILSSSVEEMLLKKRDKIKKMIDLVTSIRDISDSLPALSGGVPGALVESEPDLAVFARDAPEGRPRGNIRVPRRRMRAYPYHLYNHASAAPQPRLQPDFMVPRFAPGMNSSSSDEDDHYHHHAHMPGGGMYSSDDSDY